MFRLLIVLLATTPTIFVLGLTNIQIESYRHEYNPDLFKVMTIQLVNFTDHLGINGSIVLAQDMNDITITYTASVPKDGGRPWILIKNKTSNVCELLEFSNTNSKNIFSIALNILKSSSYNFPTKCPLKKDREIAFYDLYFNGEKYPVNFPDTTVNGILSMSSKKILVYTGYMTVSIVTENEKRSSG